MRACETCGAMVVDLRHERTGRLAPIDAMPVPHGGNVVVDEEAGTYRVLTKVERAARFAPAPDGPGDEALSLELHRSHFATCSAAGAWRRR